MCIIAIDTEIDPFITKSSYRHIPILPHISAVSNTFYRCHFVKSIVQFHIYRQIVISPYSDFTIISIEALIHFAIIRFPSLLNPNLSH
jgi:hypothetical protein